MALGSNSVANSPAAGATAGFTPIGGTAISAATATGGEVSVVKARWSASCHERGSRSECHGRGEREPVAVGRREGGTTFRTSPLPSRTTLRTLRQRREPERQRHQHQQHGEQHRERWRDGYFHTNSTLADSAGCGRVDSVAVGPNAIARGQGSIAIGRNASMAAATPADGAIAIGDSSWTAYSQDMALGQNATAGGGAPSR